MSDKENAAHFEMELFTAKKRIKELEALLEKAKEALKVYAKLNGIKAKEALKAIEGIYDKDKK